MMYRYYSKLRTALCHSYKCNRQYSVSQLEKVVAEKTYSIKDEVIVGRPLYMDAQSTTSLVCLHHQITRLDFSFVGPESLGRDAPVSHVILWQSTLADARLRLGIGGGG
jgi:hypothetical protein